MALKQEETTINGTRYQVTQLPYSKGKPLLLRLYKVLGPALADAFGQLPKGKDLGDLELSSIAPAIAGAFDRVAQNLTEADFDFAVETLGEYTLVYGENGQPSKLNSAEREFRYAGNWGELFQWLSFALRVNYLGFSNGQDALTAALSRAKEKVSQSRSGSTGKSTE